MAKAAKKPKKVNVLDPEYRLQTVQEYMRMWMELFQFIDDDIRDRKITPEDENRFSQHVSALASRHIQLEAVAGEDMKKVEDIAKILEECVSCSYIKQMPDTHFGKLQFDWHEIFLEMNKCIGKIMKHPKLLKKNRANKQNQQQAQA